MKVNARLKPSRYGVADSRSNRASRCIAFLCLAAAACSGSAGIGAVSCGIPGGAPPPAAQHTPIGQLTPIDIDALLAHTKMLSSDAFEGRAPGTKGEDLSVAYLADQFTKLGLKPGNTDGTYMQKVPLVGITPAPAPLVAEKGAAGVLIVHETGPAGYGFNVVQGKTGEQFDLVTPDKNMGRAAIEGWITLDQAKKLLQSSGQDFEALKKQAATREFKPVPLGATASMTIRNTLRTIDSRNVLAKLDGSDPNLKDEYIVYTAHWDHFGKTADGIFHGAEDDGLGCAALVEVARAFTRLPAPPRRSILFLAVTAEEQGLLGSQYYSMTPVYPLAKTLADINMDSWNVHGRTRDMTLTGFGASELDDYARDAAAEPGRVVPGDAEPEKGFYYRSDHFNFAKQGVPALNPDSGVDYIGKPTDYARQVRAEWTEHRYHKQQDVVTADWDLTGAREDLRVVFAVGYRVAQADKMPEWKPGNEFRAKA